MKVYEYIEKIIEENTSGKPKLVCIVDDGGFEKVKKCLKYPIATNLEEVVKSVEVEEKGVIVKPSDFDGKTVALVQSLVSGNIVVFIKGTIVDQVKPRVKGIVFVSKFYLPLCARSCLTVKASIIDKSVEEVIKEGEEDELREPGII